MDDTIVEGLTRATQKAALHAEAWIGKGDRKAADGAAVEGMRKALNQIAFEGTVVIGEGERDKAPMLFLGEKVGTGGPSIDLAVDPLEGTNMAANNDYNSIAVLAASPKGTLLKAPDVYMDKIAVGPGVGDRVSLEKSVEENLDIVSSVLEKPLEDLVVIIMDRERNRDLIERVRKKGCRIKLIMDGDIYGAIATCLGEADMLMGIGAAPEGIIAASAVKSLGGYIEGKLWFKDEEMRAKAREMNAPEGLLRMDDMVKGDDSVFVATGVTEGFLIKGVRKVGNGKEGQTIIIRKGGKEIMDFKENLE